MLISTIVMYQWSTMLVHQSQINSCASQYLRHLKQYMQFVFIMHTSTKCCCFLFVSCSIISFTLALVFLVQTRLNYIYTMTTPCLEWLCYCDFIYTMTTPCLEWSCYCAYIYTMTTPCLECSCYCDYINTMKLRGQNCRVIVTISTQ